MIDSDRAMAVSFVMITTWSWLFWSRPSLVFALFYPYMVVILILLWLWVGVDNGDR